MMRFWAPLKEKKATPIEWSVWAIAWALVFYWMVSFWAPADAPTIAAWLVLGIGFLVLVGVLQCASPIWGWASRVTFFRALIVLSLASFLWWPEAFVDHGLELGLLGLVALLADGLDGHLARKREEQSEVGARFDMETDAALMLVLSIAMGWTDRVGMWVLWIGALRYAFVGAGMFLPFLNKPLPESMRRKVICVVQVSVLLAVMPPWFTDGQAFVLLAIALALLLYSFALDTMWLWKNQSTTTNNEA